MTDQAPIPEDLRERYLKDIDFLAVIEGAGGWSTQRSATAERIKLIERVAALEARPTWDALVAEIADLKGKLAEKADELKCLNALVKLWFDKAATLHDATCDESGAIALPKVPRKGGNAKND